MERNHSAPVSSSVDLPTLLRGRNIVLRPLRTGDVERVAEIQAEPSVARWWGSPNKAQLHRQANGSDDDKALAIEREGELVGLIQYHEENEPDFRHAGIDVFLAERVQGHGLGTDAVRTVVRYLIDERVREREVLQPGDGREGLPRVVHGAEERHRQHDGAEGELNVAGVDKGPHHQPDDRAQ